MIRFNCPTCSKQFTVRDQDAGRRAVCRACGQQVTVPEPEAAAAAVASVGLASSSIGEAGRAGSASPAGDGNGLATATLPGVAAAEPVKRIPMRIRRLTVDAEQMRSAFKDFPHIQILSAEGEPPELYRLRYNVKSLDRGKKPNQPVPRDVHEVEIQLTADYPRVSPKCRMLTPVFHPNIDPATICVGDHWAAGERLVDLAIRIGEMLAFQAYNIKSPLDAEAAMWADLNADKLPTDHRDMRPADL